MGARKPDGGSARTERVSFTRPAAERIAKVVRTVEQGNRGAAGLSFTPRAVGGGGGGKAFRVCTFTGAWATAEAKTVTLKYQPTTPNTLTALNLTFHLPDMGTESEHDCHVAKDGTAWFLISAIEHNVKRGTFSAPWNKNNTATVSVVSGGTVAALNRHADISGDGTKNCTIGRDGMEWELIAAEC